MALSTLTYVDNVFYRIGKGAPEEQAGIWRTSIEASLPDALKKLAQVAVGSEWRSLLENDYSLTISGSSASFSAQTDLLPESIKVCNHITHSSVANRFRILDQVTDLDYAASISDSILAFAAIGANAVHFRYPAGSLTGTLTVRAVKIPTLGTLPNQLDDRLVDVGVSLFLAPGK